MRSFAKVAFVAASALAMLLLASCGCQAAVDASEPAKCASEAMARYGIQVGAEELDVAIEDGSEPMDVRNAMNALSRYGLAHNLTGRRFEALPTPCIVWLDGGSCSVLLSDDGLTCTLVARGEHGDSASTMSVESAYKRNGRRCVYFGPWDGAEVLDDVELPHAERIQ